MSASKVLKTWEAACQLLSGVSSTASALQVVEVLKLLATCSNTKVQYDVRTVDKLVKAKVPLRVWQESVRLVQAGAPNHTLLGVNAAHLVLNSLLKQGKGAKLASSNSSTISSVQQQLQQSGLLAQLPALLTDAAQSLEAAAAAGPAADEAAAREVAQTTLLICTGSMALWQDAWKTELCVPCIAPSFQLIAQCNKYLTTILNTSNSSNGDGSSSQQQQQQPASSQQQQQQQQLDLETLGSATEAWSCALVHLVCILACGLIPGFTPRLELLQGLATPLPNSQHFLEVFAVEVSKVLLQPLVSQQRARQQQQQGGGSTDWQWELACKLAPKVPLEVAAVLQAVHCSRELALWQAITAKPWTAEGPDENLAILVGALMGMQLDRDGQRLAGIAGPQQPQQTVMLRLLMVVALMRWASSRSCVTCTDVEAYQRVFWHAHHACRDFGSHRPQREQEQKEGVVLLPPRMLQLLQQHVSALVPQLLQLRRLQLAALQAVSNRDSSSSSSSSSSSGSGDSCGGSSPFTDATGQSLMDAAVSQSAALTALLTNHAVAQTKKQRQLDPSPAAAGGAEQPDTWGVGRMCGLLEDLLRSEAGTRAQLGGNSSSDLQLHRQLLLYLLPAQGHTRMPLCDCLAINGAGAGGKAASQLLGLLVGMLNGFCVLLQQSDPACVQMGMRVCAATLRAVVEVLTQAPGAAQQDGSDAAAAATALLPWLVLHGRCCLLLGEDEQEGELCGAAEFMDMPCVHVEMEVTTTVEGQTSVESETSVVPTPASILCVMQLVGGPHAAHLSGLGYDMQLLRQNAWELSMAHREYAAADDDADRVAALQRVSTQLKALGQSLCAFAVPDMCNNPRCRNVCGPSEAVLVGGRSCLCGGCRVARYCSRVCQKQNWKGQHKPVCEALAAAAAAAGGGAAAAVSH